jgi:hypothetical protein
MGNSKFESRPIGLFQYIVGYWIWKVKKQAGHSLVETVTVNKQIGAQVPLRVCINNS